MNVSGRDSRPVHTLRVRARQWPSHPLDARWLAALRRAGIETADVAALRAAVTCDRAEHTFETQTFHAARQHWSAVYRALWAVARQRWGMFARATRVRQGPVAGPEDTWLRGTAADLKQPIADRERNYYYLRTVRCEWSVRDGVLVAPYALVREDMRARQHVLLSLCVIEAELAGGGDVVALGGCLDAPRAQGDAAGAGDEAVDEDGPDESANVARRTGRAVPARARPHHRRPDPVSHVVRATAVDAAPGVECLARVGRFVEVLATDAPAAAGAHGARPMDAISDSPPPVCDDGVDVYDIGIAPTTRWDEWSDEIPPLWGDWG